MSIKNISQKLLHKKYLLLFFVLSFGSFAYLWFQTHKSGPIPTNTPQQTTPSPEIPLPPNVALSPKQYYLSKISSPGPVSLLYWKTPPLLGLVNNKIIDLTNNSQVYLFPAKITPFSSQDNQNISVVSNKQLLVYDSASKTITNINNYSNKIFSPSFKRWVDKSTGQISLSVSSTQTVSDIKSYSQFVWAPTEDKLLLLSQSQGVIMLVNNLERQTILAENAVSSAKLSSTGRYLGLINNRHLIIRDLQDNSIVQDFGFDQQTNKALFVWTPQDQLFLIEKEYTPQEVDFMYLLSPSSSKKVFLLDSFPIPTRISFDVEPVSSPRGDLVVVDSSNNAWLITTTPSQKFNIPTNLNHEDSF